MQACGFGLRAWHSAFIAWLLVLPAAGNPSLSTLNIPATDRQVVVNYNAWQATSIVLGASSPVRRVQSLTLRLAQDVPNKNFTVQIVGSASLRPDLANVVASFGNPAAIANATAASPNSLATNLIFPAAVSPAPLLQPGQTYWIVVGVSAPDLEFTPSSGLYYWSFANLVGQDPDAAAGLNVGSYVASSGTAGQNWTSEVASAFSFALESAAEGANMTLAQWRAMHPGGPADNAAFLSSDSDGDGLNGLIEFSFDLDPTKPDANSLALLDLQYDYSMGRPILSHKRWPNAPEIRYSLQWSENLIGWTEVNQTEIDETVTPPASADKPASVRFTIRRQSWPNRVFFRIHVSAN